MSHYISDHDPDDYIRVTVTAVDYPGGTLALGRGVAPDGRDIEFAGEPRWLHAIAEALAYGEQPVALVPLWAVVRHVRTG